MKHQKKVKHFKFPRAQGEVFVCLVLSCQQAKIQRFSVYNDLKLKKAADSLI